jgi:hypothetical protein
MDTLAQTSFLKIWGILNNLLGNGYRATAVAQLTQAAVAQLRVAQLAISDHLPEAAILADTLEHQPD